LNHGKQSFRLWIVAVASAEPDAHSARTRAAAPIAPVAPVAVGWILHDGSHSLPSLANGLAVAFNAPLQQRKNHANETIFLRVAGCGAPCLYRTEFLPAEGLSWSCRVAGWSDDRTTNGCKDRSERTNGRENTWTMPS